MKTCVFIAIVVVGLSGGRFSDEKGCCLSSKTREKNVCRGRMIELSTEMARVAEVDCGILWDEEGNWPEALKSRACSRECPVVWPLWSQRSRFLVLTKRSAATGDKNTAWFELYKERGVRNHGGWTRAESDVFLRKIPNWGRGNRKSNWQWFNNKFEVKAEMLRRLSFWKKRLV